MLSLSSDCCRVDAVKASANQLKMQLAQLKVDDAHKSKAQSANGQVQTVDVQIKAGDATKAELALSAAKSAVQVLQYDKAGVTSSWTAPQAITHTVNVQV